MSNRAVVGLVMGMFGEMFRAGTAFTRATIAAIILLGKKPPIGT